MRPLKHTLLVLVGVALGVALGWRLFGDVRAPSQEDPAAAIILPSGGVVAERGEPPVVLPPLAREAERATGGEVVRVGHVVVQPTPRDAGNPPAASPDAEPVSPASDCICRPEPVRLDWALVRAEDGYRMAVSAAGAEILEATDAPLQRLPARPSRPWAAGLSLSYDMSQRKAVGVFIDRDVGRLRLGLEISQRDGGTATLRAGLRF